jgi:hypothetical protein
MSERQITRRDTERLSALSGSIAALRGRVPGGVLPEEVMGNIGDYFVDELGYKLDQLRRGLPYRISFNDGTQPIVASFESATNSEQNYIFSPFAPHTMPYDGNPDHHLTRDQLPAHFRTLGTGNITQMNFVRRPIQIRRERIADIEPVDFSEIRERIQGMIPGTVYTVVYRAEREVPSAPNNEQGLTGVVEVRFYDRFVRIHNDHGQSYVSFQTKQFIPFSDIISIEQIPRGGRRHKRTRSSRRTKSRSSRRSSTRRSSSRRSSRKSRT